MESFSITFVSALLYFILQLTASECELVFVFWFGGGGRLGSLSYNKLFLMLPSLYM